MTNRHVLRTVTDRYAFRTATLPSRDCKGAVAGCPGILPASQVPFPRGRGSVCGIVQSRDREGAEVPTALAQDGNVVAQVVDSGRDHSRAVIGNT